MAVVAFFKYRNHRGEVADRRVRVDTVGYLDNPSYGYQPGWFLHGLCLDKNQPRSFALASIIRPRDEEGVRLGNRTPYTLLNL